MQEFLKKYKKNIILVIIFAFIVYFYIVSKNDMSLFMEKFNQINLFWLLLAFVLMLMYWVIESHIFNIFIKLYDKTFSLWKTIKLVLATTFFNNITPFASGGQPFQIYYLSKTTTKSSDAISITMLNYIVFQIATIIIGLFFLITKYFYFRELLGDYAFLIPIGFLCTLFITVLLGSLAMSRRIYHVFFDLVLGKISKWKIFRRFNIEAKKQGLIEYVNQFSGESKTLFKNKMLMISTIIYNFIKILIFYSIPILILLSIGEKVDGNIMNILAVSSFTMMFIAYIPIPGSTGAAEGSFHTLISVFYQESSVLFCLLLWRMATYYLGLIVGYIALMRLDFSQKKIDDDGKNKEEDLNYSV